MEYVTASAFVDIPGHAYGTRSSTVLTVSRHPDLLLMTDYWFETHGRTHAPNTYNEIIEALSFTCNGLSLYMF